MRELEEQVPSSIFDDDILRYIAPLIRFKKPQIETLIMNYSLRVFCSVLYRYWYSQVDY